MSGSTLKIATVVLFFFCLLLLVASLPVTDGLVMHLDANSITGVSDGNPIGTWEDQSTANNDATQSTAAYRPLYIAGDPCFLGLPVVRFDGTNDWMQLDETMINVGSFTIFLVGRFHRSTGNDMYFFNGQDNGDDGRIRIASYNGLIQSRVGNSADYTLIDHRSTDAQVYALNSATDAWVNGSFIDGPSNTSTIEPSAFNLGSYNRGQKDWLQGDIAEVILYNRVLDSTEIDAVNDYLEAKYFPSQPPSQSLKVDFTRAGRPVYAGWEGYFATHEDLSSFTTQSYGVFETTVSITPTWVPGAVNAAAQMYDRDGDDGTDAESLLRDWIGTDAREVGDPMTLTIEGLPAGNYIWKSYHHDTHDQTGLFDVTVNDAAGSVETIGVDISSTWSDGITQLADATAFYSSIASNGTDPVTLVFDCQNSSGSVSTVFFVMNGFELFKSSKAVGPVPADNEDRVSLSTDLSWLAPTEYTPTSYDVYFGTEPNAHNNPKYTVYTNNCNPPNDLAEGTNYYWAVDSNDSGTIHPGNDWSFTTYEPVTTGDSVANYILSQALTTFYASACSYYGVMIYSEARGDTELRDHVIAAYPSEYYSGAQMPPEGHVDKNVYGIVPFELYRQTHDANYLTAALYLADEEFANPRPDGLSEYTRFWIDDTYMIGSLQTQAYRSMADPNYIDRAVTQLLGYMGEVENLQQPNGLFYHTLDAPFHWGRGNGWAAASMTEVLLSTPQDHPQRAQLLTKYQNMMAALVSYQDTSGMWYQVLDMGSDPRNWLESSCTGMFVFALMTGVDQGWLPEEPYEKAALDGWAALEDYVDEQGRVHEVCIGTGEGSDVQFYFDRPSAIADPHGQAAVIWAATAIERLRLKGDFNTDGDVDFVDLQILANNWLGDEPSADIAPSGGDSIINLLDLAKLAENWLRN